MIEQRFFIQFCAAADAIIQSLNPFPSNEDQTRVFDFFIGKK